MERVTREIGKPWKELIKEPGVETMATFATAELEAAGGLLTKLADFHKKFKDSKDATDKITEASRRRGWKVIPIQEKEIQVYGIVMYSRNTNRVAAAFKDGEGHLLVIRYKANRHGVCKAGTRTISFTKGGREVPKGG